MNLVPASKQTCGYGTTGRAMFCRRGLAEVPASVPGLTRRR